MLSLGGLSLDRPLATHRGYTDRHVGPPIMGAAKGTTPWTGVTSERMWG